MRTEEEIIEAMLELQNRITITRVDNEFNESELSKKPYYLMLNNRLTALKFVMGMVEVIA